MNGKSTTPMEALWESPVRSRLSEPSLVIDIKGFEGPLDLLLHLARNQRVDLARISVLALVEQYLVFIRQAQALRLELAADYLVMAAWLAYLKSKLLIPKAPGDDGESGEELAATLQFRLKRLEAMRDAAAKLINRNRLGRDVFARGMPEAVIVDQTNTYAATLYEILTAYASQRQKRAVSHVQIARRTVWSLKDARDDPDAAGRRDEGLDSARSIFAGIYLFRRRSGRRQLPVLLPPAWKWSAKGISKSARPAHSTRSICATGQ